ncbi:MAG: DNA repair protein RecO [Eubacteriales bacterium]|nr:DNA repair protein RecO [Eubacteriales bacterium]
MSHESIRGFVLREISIGESDRLIEILTADRGLITAIAKGARRAKSPLIASTLIFSFSEFNLFSYKGKWTIDSAELIETFNHLREDLDRLICAAHLAEVILDLVRDALPDSEIYQLWAYSCHHLQKANDPYLTAHIAQFRALADAGFAPQLSRCITCGCQPKPTNQFDYQARGWFCLTDFRIDRQHETIFVSGALLACLNYCLTSPIDRLFAFKLDQTIRDEVCRFSDTYLTTIMEKKYSRLNMLQDL